MPQEATQNTHNLITSTSDAYFEAARGSPSTTALYHARFLRNLVDNDIFKNRAEQERLERLSEDSRMHGGVFENFFVVSLLTFAF